MFGAVWLDREDVMRTRSTAATLKLALAAAVSGLALVGLRRAVRL
jgi:hypothetical protein